MKKRMVGLTIYVDDSNDIVLLTDDDGNGGEMICIPPEQVDVVIQWLKEAKEEAIQGSRTGNGVRSQVK